MGRKGGCSKARQNGVGNKSIKISATITLSGKVPFAESRSTAQQKQSTSQLIYLSVPPSRKRVNYD